jgi:lipopolysaccharide/colanic/teichoic acid biosynthesis glycosyltransferase
MPVAYQSFAPRWSRSEKRLALSGAEQPFASGAVSSPPRASRIGLRGALKRTLDVGGAAALLLAFCPVIVAAAALIMLEGRPVLFVHERIGRNGIPFRCLKFRTMAADAEARLAQLLSADPMAAKEWEEMQKLRRDPRVTSLVRRGRCRGHRDHNLWHIHRRPALLFVLEYSD